MRLVRFLFYEKYPFIVPRVTEEDMHIVPSVTEHYMTHSVHFYKPKLNWAWQLRLVFPNCYDQFCEMTGVHGMEVEMRFLGGNKARDNTSGRHQT